MLFAVLISAVSPFGSTSIFTIFFKAGITLLISLSFILQIRAGYVIVFVGYTTAHRGLPWVWSYTMFTRLLCVHVGHPPCIGTRSFGICVVGLWAQDNLVVWVRPLADFPCFGLPPVRLPRHRRAGAYSPGTTTPSPCVWAVQFEVDGCAHRCTRTGNYLFTHLVV